MITKQQLDFFNSPTIGGEILENHEDDFLLSVKAIAEGIVSWESQEKTLDTKIVLELTLMPETQLKKLAKQIDDILKNDKNTFEYQTLAHARRQSWAFNNAIDEVFWSRGNA